MGNAGTAPCSGCFTHGRRVIGRHWIWSQWTTELVWNVVVKRTPAGSQTSVIQPVA